MTVPIFLQFCPAHNPMESTSLIGLEAQYEYSLIESCFKGDGIKKGVKVVFSSEETDKGSLILTDGTNFKKSAYGTMSYLPATFGATLASVVIRDLMEDGDETHVSG